MNIRDATFNKMTNHFSLDHRLIEKEIYIDMNYKIMGALS